VKSGLWGELKTDGEVSKRGANGVRSHWDAVVSLGFLLYLLDTRYLFSDRERADGLVQENEEGMKESFRQCWTVGWILFVPSQYDVLIPAPYLTEFMILSSRF
jgi:hypothetical protein